LTLIDAQINKGK